MVKRMLIDATHAEETRVVVVNGTRLEEFDVETSTKKQLKGNIYLAKIVRVEPSLQAAFVDYGGNRHGFLAFSEIHPDYYQIPVADRQALLAEQREVMKRSSTAAAADFGDDEGGRAHGDNGADHNGDEDGETPAAAESAHGDEPAAGADHQNGDEGEEETRRRPRSLRHYKIQEVIKRRQIVLVQVVKEERGNKGAALTTYLSLAGRYCVLMPNTARGGGVSRKITNVQDRKRLKAITNDMSIPDGMAVIVRTAGSERTKPEIKRDYEYLLRLWDSVRDLTLKSVSPALVYEEANLIKRSIRDLYSRDIEEIQVDGEEGYRTAKDFMRMLTPSHARRVQLFKDPAMPLFQRFQVEAQLDSMHSPVVQLKSGGYLVINQTEALVAIDVNSGRSTKERHIEETALKTNLEAADEVARQLRLRDLAGLIVIDFIDMEEGRNNHAVERRLKDAMRFDRARIQLGKISAFGLMELSRQRLRPSLMETSFLPCPHCGGTGSVRSVESASMHVLRAIEEEGIRRRSSEVTVTVHSSIALYILNQKRRDLADIEARYGFAVFLTGDDSLVPPQLRMEKVRSEMLMDLPREKPVSQDQPIAELVEEGVEEIEEEESPEPVAAEAESSEAAAEAPAEAAGEDGDGARRRRRRRRRRGRRDEAGQPLENDAQGEGEAVAADAEGAGETDADADIGEEDAAEVPAIAAEAAEAAEAADTTEDGETDAADGDAANGVIDGEPTRRRRRGKRGGRRRHRRADGSLSADGVNADGEIEGELPAGDEAESDQDANVTSAADLPPVAAFADSQPEVTAEVLPTLDSAPVETAPAIAPEPVIQAEPEEKPKRRRTSRKAAAAEPTVAAEAVIAEAAPEKPKRKRAPARSKAAQVTAAPVAAEAPPAAELPPAPEQTPAPASENQPPVLEHAAASGIPDSKPARKGWWNR